MPKVLLEKVLKEKGYSKRRFAKELGVDYRLAFRYTQKNYDPKLSTLSKWAKILNCKISDLYKE